MECEDFEAMSDLLLEDVLSEALRHRMEKHALLCARCAHNLHTLQQVRAMLQEYVATAEMPPSFRERTQARLQQTFAPSLHYSHSENGSQYLLPFAEPEQETQ